MADVTEILGQLPPEAALPIDYNSPLEIFKRLMAQGQTPDPQQVNQLLSQQGANIRTSDISPQQSPIVNDLISQQMTRGLSPTQYGGGNESGLTYSGGVAGYAGPPRLSDSTPVRTATYKNQAGQEAMVESERLRNLPGPGGKGTMGEVLDLLGLSKMVPVLAQESFINSLKIPGITAHDPRGDRSNRPNMAIEAATELTSRKTDPNKKPHPILGGFTNDELKIIAGVEPKPTAPKPPPTPNSNTTKFLTATYEKVYRETKGNDSQKKAAALAAARNEAQLRKFSDVNLDEGFFSNTVSPVGGATPLQPQQPSFVLPQGVKVERLK